MNVWLIHPGELLPIDGDVRLYRYGVLAEMLSRQGHQVVRWAPTFVHVTKRQRCTTDATVSVNERYRIELVHAPGYRFHLGIRRFLFHRTLARRLLARAAAMSPPDVIVCGMPAPELCQAALTYGRRHRVPVVIDVRDVWPDALLNFLPAWSRRAAGLLVRRASRRNEAIFRSAAGIIAITDNFLEWGLNHAGRPAGAQDGVFFMGYPRSEPLAEPERAAAARRWRERGVHPDSRFRASFLAAIGSLYDLRLLLRFARHLQLQGDDEVQFVICGDGPSVPTLRREAADLPNVILPGWVDKADVQWLLDHTQVGIIPYRAGTHTALPNKAVTLLSAGLPLISTAGGELARLLESRQCGATYRAEDLSDLVRVFEGLRHAPLRRGHLGVNARRFFEKELEASRVYPRLIDHLECLVRAGGPSARCA